MTFPPPSNTSPKPVLLVADNGSGGYSDLTSAAGTPSASATTVQGIGYASEAQFTRPNDTTPYSARDVVGPAVTGNLAFAAAGPAGGGKVLIDRVTLRLDRNSVASGMAGFRLHLYSSGPTALADNAAYNLISADRAKYLGCIELPTPIDNGDTIWADTEAMGLPVRMQLTVPSGGALVGVLETLGAYTPEAQTVNTVGLHGMLV